MSKQKRTPLRKMRIRNMELRDSNIDGICMVWCFVDNVDLTGSSIRKVDFDGGHLKRINFSSCDLYHSNFHKADLHSSVLDGANAVQCHFAHSFLSGGQLQGRKPHRGELP